MEFSDEISILKKIIYKLEQENSELKKGYLEVMQGEGWVEVPALGHPIHPGMLYVCRSESFRPESLWASDSVVYGKISLPIPTTETQYLNHSLLYDVNPCSYLTLHYKRTTRLDLQTPSLLEKQIHPEVIQQQTATHAVIAVTYGAQAFLVLKGFSSRKRRELVKMLKNMIPTCSAEDGAPELLVPEHPKNYFPGLYCAYYGDLEAEKVVRGYRQIVDLWKSLPEQLVPSGEKAGPLKENDPDTGIVVCFTLTSLGETDLCLSSLTQYLQSLQKQTQTRPTHLYQNTQLPWFKSEENKNRVGKLSQSFRS
ncbi:unnamed protein product [Coregonus sp. 'balchen']|nr:unnamed protein product [Coregonus sp. 'balchen']